jgi:hypothetical protein
MAAAPQSNVVQAAADAISTLRASSSSAYELARCCQLLADLDNVSDADAVSAVVGAMQTHPTHAALQRCGCKALSSLGFDSAAHRARAGAVGGVDAVVAAMRAFPVQKQFQVSACFALANTTNDNAQNRIHAGAAGAVPAVVAALKAHDCTDLLVVGCQALANLICDDFGNAAAAAPAGAIDVVMAVLRGRRASARCYASACSALSKLAAFEEPRCIIVAAGGIETVLAVLHAHAADAMVSASACNAVGNLYGAGKSLPCTHASSLAAAVAVAVVSTLNAHCGCADAQMYGCYALCNVARGGAPPERRSNVVHVRAAGGISAAVAAMRAHPSDAVVQMHGCNALDNMCADDKSVALEAGAAGAVEAVTHAMHTLAAHGDMQRGCCRSMHILVAADAAIQAKALTSGAVEALVHTLQASADGEGKDWHSDACWALAFITKHNADKADIPGGIEAVVATLRRATRERARDADDAGDAAAGDAVRADGTVAVPLEASMLYALLLLIRGHDGRQERAVRAGALEAASAAGESDVVARSKAAHDVLSTLLPLLHAAAQRHDAGDCTQPAGCARCAGMRACGTMCALPGCCARQRAALTESGNTSLLRCGRCRLAAYCGAAHQHDDWARHKAECRRAQADDNGATTNSAWPHPALLHGLTHQPHRRRADAPQLRQRRKLGTRNGVANPSLVFLHRHISSLGAGLARSSSDVPTTPLRGRVAVAWASRGTPSQRGAVCARPFTRTRRAHADSHRAFGAARAHLAGAYRRDLLRGIARTSLGVAGGAAVEDCWARAPAAADARRTGVCRP